MFLWLEVSLATLFTKECRGKVFLATFVAFGLLDRVGRRTLLVSGAIGMAISMATLATLGLVYGEVSGSSSGSDSTDQPMIESRTVGYM